MQKFSKILKSIQDEKIISIKKRFFSEPQKIVSKEDFIEKADNWFMSTKI